MSKVTIYHNPRCSKSRQALELIRKQGIEPVVIEYLKTPPSARELKKILKLLGLKPRGLARTKEPEYEAARLDNPDLPDDAVIAGMIAHPKIIERPIVLANGKAVIGRPPENIHSIL